MVDVQDNEAKVLVHFEDILPGILFAHYFDNKGWIGCNGDVIAILSVFLNLVAQGVGIASCLAAECEDAFHVLVGVIVNNSRLPWYCIWVTNEEVT